MLLYISYVLEICSLLSNHSVEFVLFHILYILHRAVLWFHCPYILYIQQQFISVLQIISCIFFALQTLPLYLDFQTFLYTHFPSFQFSHSSTHLLSIRKFFCFLNMIFVFLPQTLSTFQFIFGYTYLYRHMLFLFSFTF